MGASVFGGSTRAGRAAILPEKFVGETGEELPVQPKKAPNLDGAAVVMEGGIILVAVTGERRKGDSVEAGSKTAGVRRASGFREDFRGGLGELAGDEGDLAFVSSCILLCPFLFARTHLRLEFLGEKAGAEKALAAVGGNS